jgi:hypothetical protein
MEIHEKIYVPEYSIQGEDIPLSITWDKSKPITISVSFSENIEIKEIYNIDDSEFEVKRRRRTPLQADGASEASPHKDSTTRI